MLFDLIEKCREMLEQGNDRPSGVCSICMCDLIDDEDDVDAWLRTEC